MKKIFTLIAVAAMAISANAQGTIVFGDETATSDDPVALPTIPEVSNLTVSFNPAETAKIKIGTTKEAIFMGTTQFPKRLEFQNGNPKDADGKAFSAGGGVPTQGSFVKLEPKVAGYIYYAGVFNGSKKVQFVEDGVAMGALNYFTTSYDELEETYSSQLAGTITPGDQFSAKVYGVVEIPVKANSVYYAFIEGSKIAFAGLIYSQEKIPTGINNVKAAANNNGATYNLAGQKVNAAAKGLVIKNGVKVINK